MSLMKGLKSRTVYVKFDLEDTVYEKLAEDRQPGMVTSWVVTPGGIQYVVSWPHGRGDTRHYDIELTDTYLPEYVSEKEKDD